MAVISKHLYEQTLEEITASPKPSHFRWEAEFIIGDKVIKPRKVLMIDEIKDYLGNYCDEVRLEVMMILSDYEDFIFPNRNNLKVTMKEIPVFETSDQLDPKRKIITKTFSATLVTIKDGQLQDLPAVDGQQAMRPVVVQLVELGIEELRLMTIGGIYNNEKTIDVIRCLLGYYSDQLNLPEQDRIKGVEVRPPNVNEPRKNVIIPHGVSLMDMPGYIQRYAGGVYNYGLGFYLHNRVWYVYPLFNTDQYETSRFRLDILVVNRNRVQSIDRSWMLKAQTLYVITNGERDTHDKVDQLLANRGNGVRFMLATKSFNEWATVSRNVAKADPTKTTAQYEVTKRESNQKAIPFGDNRLTDNVAYETSRIVEREGRYFQFTWHHSTPRLLYPGMPVKLRYETPQGIIELYGVLIKAEVNVALDSAGDTQVKYRHNTVLTLFIKERDHQPS